MGEAKNSQRSAKAIAFADTNMCIFCGGIREASTVDHYPPRTMFAKRIWPDGYAFPACPDCNSGSRTADQWAGFLCQMSGRDTGSTDEDMRRFKRDIAALTFSQPAAMREMLSLTVSQKRAVARRVGRQPLRGESYADLPVVKVPAVAAAAIETFSLKLGKALHFFHTKKIVPTNGHVTSRWYTSVNLIAGEIPDELFSTPAENVNLTRGNIDLNDQFRYRYMVTPDANLGVYIALFGPSITTVSTVIFNPRQAHRMKEFILSGATPDGRPVILDPSQLTD